MLCCVVYFPETLFVIKFDYLIVKEIVKYNIKITAHNAVCVLRSLAASDHLKWSKEKEEPETAFGRDWLLDGSAHALLHRSTPQDQTKWRISIVNIPTYSSFEMFNY